jgi:integrase
LWEIYVVSLFLRNTTLPRHLQKRYRRWYAVLEIPKELRHQFGKARFFQTLETESLGVAERRVLPIITAWKREIAEARGDPVDDDAAFWRRKLRNTSNEKQRRQILEEIDFAAWEIGAINVENIGDPPSSAPEARQFYASATGQRTAFTDHLDEWLSSSQSTAKTKDMQSADVIRFAREFRSFQDVSRAEVRRWVVKRINEDGIAPSTVQRTLSGLRSYWRYLQTMELVDEDHEPFSNLDVVRRNKHATQKSARQPFQGKDVLSLHGAAIKLGDAQLADLIHLAMYTGCRIEELCSLKVAQVKDDYFSISDAKTKAGWRDVPIHMELVGTIERLVANSRDGRLLSGLSVNKYGDRSNAIGKRFGRLKTSMEFGPQFVFHSIRKTVVTILENAGVAENIVADIVGHEKPTMTYGLYSGGVSLSVKRGALEKLTY